MSESTFSRQPVQMTNDETSSRNQEGRDDDSSIRRDPSGVIAGKDVEKVSERNSVKIARTGTAEKNAELLKLEAPGAYRLCFLCSAISYIT